MVARAVLENKLYNVVPLEEYAKKPELYPVGLTAIDVGDKLLPLRNKTDFSPGLYDSGSIMDYRKPSAEELPNYIKDNLEIIDFSEANSTNEYMKRNERVKEINKNMLESDGNIYVPIRNHDDTPEMGLFKDALEAKHFDIKKYQSQIEETCGNYNNAVRLLTKESISFQKMKAIGKATNLKISLTIEDESDDVPNAMNQTFNCVITGGDIDVED